MRQKYHPYSKILMNVGKWQWCVYLANVLLLFGTYIWEVYMWHISAAHCVLSRFTFWFDKFFVILEFKESLIIEDVWKGTKQRTRFEDENSTEYATNSNLYSIIYFVAFAQRRRSLPWREITNFIAPHKKILFQSVIQTCDLFTVA